MNNQKIGSSPGQNLKTVYEQVFEEIYPHIKEGMEVRKRRTDIKSKKKRIEKIQGAEV